MGVFDLGPSLRMQHVEASMTSLAVPGKSVAAGLGALIMFSKASKWLTTKGAY